MTHLPDHLDLARHDWLREPALRHIMDVVAAGGGEARPVGGAVRDALIGKTVKEVDLAVNLPPDKITQLLTDAGIKVVPTGIEHGTVTAVVNHKAYELTSLRRDIETFGRRATVSFTEDWRIDAERRDFTFNALYVDARGTLYDYCDGRADLANGRVRFIGDAHERIQEDVLRIFRFFRFFAWYGKGQVDSAGLQASVQMASLLPQLSVERVWRELVKLLAAPDPAPAWQLMMDGFILAQLLPEADHIQRLQGLLQVERHDGTALSYLVRLAALIPQSKAASQHVASRLRFSNREAESLSRLAELPALLKGKLDPVPLRRILYAWDAESVRDALYLLAAEQQGLDIHPALLVLENWEKPVFPLQGEDVLKMGIVPGAQVGALLRQVEEWWIGQDFRADRAACLAKLQSLKAGKL